MIKLLSNLLSRAGIVKNETVSLANTAIRVGSLIEDALRSGVTVYDNTVAYQKDQYTIYKGVLTQAVTSTDAGDAPDSTLGKPKWSSKIVINPEAATESNNLPIAASAVVALIAASVNSGDGVPNADTTKRGIARQSTDIEFNEGINNDTFVTPKQTKSLSVTIFNAISNAVAKALLTIVTNATTADRSAALLLLLNAADAETLDKLCQLNSACGSTVEWIVDQQYEEATPIDLLVEWIVDAQYEEAIAPPQATGIFRIVGPSTIVEGAAGQYKVEERLSNETWVTYSGSIIWSTVSAPSGIGVNTTGLLAVGADTITADVIMAIHAAISSSVIEFPVTISNTAPSISGYHISGPSSFTENTTSAPFSVIIDYSDGSTLVYVGAGTFSLPGDTTGSVINGGSGANITLTSPANSVTANTALTLRFTFPGGTPVINKTVTVVNSTPPANTVQYVQARFVPNFFGSGANNDLLEIQMMDTYPATPMGINVLLASSPPPTSTGGAFVFQRGADGVSADLRNFRLASGQNLKNKSFKFTSALLAYRTLAYSRSQREQAQCHLLR